MSIEAFKGRIYASRVVEGLGAMKGAELPRGYLAIGAGYSYAPLRVGLALRAPDGREVYFQPGDHESTIRETIDALGECDDNIVDRVAYIALSEYF